MLTVLLGLAGALAYGAGDFFGGLASRRVPAIRATALAAMIGIAPILVGFLVVDSRFSPAAFVDGAVAGVAGSIGVVLLYAALAVGPMSVLSPITAVVSAIVPVVVGVSRGIVLSPVGVGAVALGVVAVVLVAAAPADPDATTPRVGVRGVLVAVASGTGFGVLVLALAATPAGSGVAPLLVARVTETVLLAIAVLVTMVVASPGRRGAAPVGTLGQADDRPRQPPSARRVGSRRGFAVVVIACGVCDAGANILIQAGLHSSTDPSTLPVMSVLNALYPVGTILLAASVLRERIRAVQAAGVVLAIAASVLLALNT